MSAPEPPFQPSTVTKPIQLLAAWLIGLVAIDSAFLASSALISKPDWAAGALVIAAILNVPLFLVALFLLQTKFRPEMQEDTYYSKYLERRSELTGKVEKIAVSEVQQSAQLKEDVVELKSERFNLRSREKERLFVPKGTRIFLNDMLSGASAIERDLAALGVAITDRFGSTTENKTPKNSVVAIGPDCSIPVVQSVVRISHMHGVQGIARVKSPIISDQERIVVGAYSFDPGERPFQELDHTLLSALLDPELNEKKFEELVKVAAGS